MAGRSTLGPDGQFVIEIAPEQGARVVAHEVAHAWANGGPPALDEGRAELLMVCILRRLEPDSAKQAVDDAARTPAVDLWNWRNADDADAEHRWHGYASALRMFLALEPVLPPTELWPEDPSWDRFGQALAGIPRDQSGLWAALSWLGRDSPWSDLDGDGVPNEVERALGRRPDLAEPPEAEGDGSLVLVGSGAPVCAGIAAGPDGATVQLDGPAVERVRAWTPRGSGRDLWVRAVEDGVVELRPRESLVLGAIGAEAVTVRASGTGTVADPGCWGLRLHPRADLDPADRSALEDAFAAAARRAARWLGDNDTPLVVITGRPVTSPNGLCAEGAAVSEDVPFTQVVWRLPPGAHPGAEREQVEEGCLSLGRDLEPLWTEKRWDQLAATAIALHAAWTSPLPRPDLGLAEALAWDLTSGPVVATSMAPFDDGRWHAAAVACPSGWRGVLAGKCEVPDEEPEPVPPDRIPD
jgi:hypothetical protein